jgi:hypothetical protein
MAAYVTSQPYMYRERESEHVITVDIDPGRQNPLTILQRISFLNHGVPRQRLPRPLDRSERLCSVAYTIDLACGKLISPLLGLFKARYLMAVLYPAWLCHYRDRAFKGESSGHLKSPPLVGGQNRIRNCCRFHRGEAI